MAVDDKETTDDDSAPSERRAARRSAPLPERALRALELARTAAKADRARKGGRWLAVVPAAVAVVMLLLMMPRATAPEAIPLPRIDRRALAAIERADDARAAAAEAARLPTDVLAVGSALRTLKGLEARGGDPAEMMAARRRLDSALHDLQPRDGLEADLLSLRALQTRRFLDAVARWEATRERSPDLEELAGNFVQRAEEAGWVTGSKVAFSDAERRVAFKAVWNGLTGVDARPAFGLSLDEQRALHVFYIEHPHPPEARRGALASQRRAATTPEACTKATTEEARQAELWRAEKIKRIGAIDPTYPTAYALGVSYYRAGRYDLSADAFTAFIEAHPDGVYALRARNHLKAALSAQGAL